MRRLIIVVTIALCSHTGGYSQYYYYNDKYYNGNWVFELGGSAGIINSLTDIGGRKGTGKKFIKDLNWKVTKPAIGVYIAGTYRDVLAVRLEGTFGTIQSYDSLLKNVAPSTFGRYERNLSFKTNITEIQLAAEVHPLFFKNYGGADAPRYSPYVVAGIGLFNFNPQAYLNGEWYYLHPLRTEGEGFREYPNRPIYKLTQFNLPLGLGIKYEIGPLLSARLEFLYRILFTDYLDDVSNVNYIDPALFNNYLGPALATQAKQLHDRRISERNNQRGNPNNNDAFFTIQLKLGFVIRSVRHKSR